MICMDLQMTIRVTVRMENVKSMYGEGTGMSLNFDFIIVIIVVLSILRMEYWLFQEGESCIESQNSA